MQTHQILGVVCQLPCCLAHRQVTNMSSSSKRLREEEQEIADNQLGEELNDLYAANQVSAKKANSLLAKSSKAGLKFRHAFKNEVTSKNNGVHNAARTLLRWMKKQSAWGKLYWCKIRL